MADAWEQFGRKVIAAMWQGYTEIDGGDVESWAEDAGLICRAPYDPEKHGDSPADFGTEPGEPIWEYSGAAKSAAA